MGAIIDPCPRCSDPLAGGDRRRMPDYGDEIAVSARLDAQNTKAVFPRCGMSRARLDPPTPPIEMVPAAVSCGLSHHVLTCGRRPCHASDSPNWTPIKDAHTALLEMVATGKAHSNLLPHHKIRDQNDVLLDTDR